MKENGTTQKSITDPESRLMKNNGKLAVCYNVQTAVDSKSHLIADFTVTNNCNDMGLLAPMAEAAKKAMEVGTLEVVADKGYREKADVLESLKNGIVPNVYESYNISVEIIEPDEYTIIEEVTEKEIEEIITENIILEVNENFLRDRQNNTVTCPMGCVLRKKSMARGRIRYCNRLACCKCKCKCIVEHPFGTIKRWCDGSYWSN